MEDYIAIGQVSKPQGIKGEIKVSLYSGDSKYAKNLKEIFIDGTCYKVIKTVNQNNAVIFALNGVFDRNTAELLRGKEVHALRADYPKFDNSTFFVQDLIGCELFTDIKIGTIIDIIDLKTDVFTVKTVAGKIMRFPFLKALKIDVNIEEKKVVVDKKALSEVCIYED